MRALCRLLETPGLSPSPLFSRSQLPELADRAVWIDPGSHSKQSLLQVSFAGPNFKQTQTDHHNPERNVGLALPCLGDIPHKSPVANAVTCGRPETCQLGGLEVEVDGKGLWGIAGPSVLLAWNTGALGAS